MNEWCRRAFFIHQTSSMSKVALKLSGITDSGEPKYFVIFSNKYLESDKNRTLEIAAVIFAVNPGTTIYVDNVVIFSEKT